MPAIVSGIACGPCAIGVAAQLNAEITFAQTGDLGTAIKGGLISGASAAAFHAIGTGFADISAPGRVGVLGTQFTARQLAAKAALHGLVGGVMSQLQGGKFGNGFTSAFVTQAASGAIGLIDSGNRDFSASRVIAAAVLGGTVSEISGGKFANGAITGAFSRAFNDENDAGSIENRRKLPVYEGD